MKGSDPFKLPSNLTGVHGGGRKGKTILYLMSDDTDEETMRCECQFSGSLSRATVYTTKQNERTPLSGPISGPFRRRFQLSFRQSGPDRPRRCDGSPRKGFMFCDQIGEAFFGSF